MRISLPRFTWKRFLGIFSVAFVFWLFMAYGISEKIATIVSTVNSGVKKFENWGISTSKEVEKIKELDALPWWKKWSVFGIISTFKVVLGISTVAEELGKHKHSSGSFADIDAK